MTDGPIRPLTARQRPLRQTFTEADVERLASLTGGRCYYCGIACTRAPSQADTLCFDHVEPLSRGGEDVVANLVPACLTCNSLKANMLLLEWFAVQAGLMRQTTPNGRPRVARPAEMYHAEAPFPRVAAAAGIDEALPPLNPRHAA